MIDELTAAHRRIEQLESALARRMELLDRRQLELDTVKSSHAYRLAHATQKIVERFFPLYSRRRTVLKVAAKAVLAPAYWVFRRRQTRNGPPPSDRHRLAMIPQDEYKRWMAKSEPAIGDRSASSKYRFVRMPVISIVVPVFNPPSEYLIELIESVRSQTYAQWQLCLADASTLASVRPILERYRDDRRIVVVPLPENLGIAGNTNAAIASATGEFVAFADHDDTLSPDAIFEFAKAIIENPEADIFYSDEDKLDRTGHRTEPLFKPDFAPETLRSRNYLCHLTAIRATLLKELGGLREGFNGAQDYDLILRATELARSVVHIPKILYHWRAHDGSTAANHAAKSYAFDAGRKAIVEHLDRCRTPGDVYQTSVPGTYRIRYRLDRQPKVSVIVPNRDHPVMLARCLDAVRHGTYPNWELIVVENGSTDPATRALYQQLEASPSGRVLNWDKPFNYAAVNNFAVQHATGELLLFLNNDIEAIEPDWLDVMVRQAIQPGIGAVGAKLLYPDDSIQHAGIIVGQGGVAGHGHLQFPGDAPGYHQRLLFTQNVAAVTGACMLVPRYAFDKVGGFDEGFVLAFNDVDFCLQLLEARYRIVWTPDACLYHLESKTRGQEDTVEKQRRFKREYDLFLAKWSGWLRKGDPYYSPHFRLDRPDVALKAA